MKSTEKNIQNIEIKPKNQLRLADLNVGDLFIYHYYYANYTKVLSKVISTNTDNVSMVRHTVILKLEDRNNLFTEGDNYGFPNIMDEGERYKIEKFKYTLEEFQEIRPEYFL